MTVKTTTKLKTKKQIITPTTTRKKNTSDVKEDFALTDFNEAPIPGNINSIEVGDFVSLTRSMLMINGNVLWMRGVEVRVKNLTTLKSDLVIADTFRYDGTEVQFFACWLTPVLIEEPLLTQEENNLDLMISE